MKHLPILLLFVGASIFASCKDSTEFYDCQPLILDKSELTITANKDSATFRANYPLLEIEYVRVKQDGKETEIFPVLPRDTAYNADCNTYQVDWLTFKRIDEKTIEVVALPNTSTKRNVEISLTSYGSRCIATLIQKGQKE